MIRQLQGFDKLFYNGKTMTPLVLRFGNPKDVAPVADMLCKKVLAFQYGTDGHILYKNPQRVPVYDIPNIRRMEDLCKYMVEHHTRPFEYALGSIGVNNDSIVINCNHMMADAGYLHFIIDEVVNGRNSELIDEYPRSSEFLFGTEISEASDKEIPSNYDMRLTNFISKDRDQLNSNQYSRLIISEVPAESLTCYDKQAKSLDSFRDSLLTCFYAATVAYSAQSYKCGIENRVDLRRYLKKVSWNDTCVFSMIPIITSVLPSETLAEIGKKLHSDLHNRVDSGCAFSYLKAIYEGKKGPQFNGARCEISNIGVTNVGGPLVDAYYGYSELYTLMPHIMSFTSFSIAGNGSHNVVLRLKYAPNNVSKREAKMMSASTLFALQSIDPSTPLEKAMDEIRSFQKNYLKNNKGTIASYIHLDD